MKIFTKALSIFRAKFRDKDKMMKHQWYVERVKSCYSCPFNSSNTKSKNGFKFRFWKTMNLNNSFCTICGCDILAKASEPMESCSADIKKWKSID